MFLKNIAVVVGGLAISMSALAKKEMVFFGGGGEPAGPQTIFDTTYSTYGPLRADSGWESRSYFDGGHAVSEGIAKALFNGKNKPMTLQNIKSEIASLKQRIKSGDLKSGDQLMITVATHGIPPSLGQESHNVTTTIRGQDFNMDELRELRDLAEKNGVKLAIADLSCHSGATLSLATDKTCVISMSGDGVAWNISGEGFGKKLQPGADLEEAFLASRKDPKWTTLAGPQISTEAGRKAYEATRFLAGAFETGDTLASAPERAVPCPDEKSFNFLKLVSDLKEIDKSAGLYHYVKVQFGLEPGKNQATIDKLKKAVYEYSVARNRAMLISEEAKELNQGCIDVLKTRLCGTNEQFLYGLKVLNEKKQSGNFTKDEQAELAAYQSYVKSDKFLRWEQLRANLTKDKELKEKARNVAKAEREVYDQLYKIYSENAKKPNPCRDFKI